MVRLLIYGCTPGIRSSRAIKRRCVDDIALRFLAADQAPDFRSVSRFRRGHLDAQADLFTKSRHLSMKLVMIKDASLRTAPSSKRTPPSARR